MVMLIYILYIFLFPFLIFGVFVLYLNKYGTGMNDDLFKKSRVLTEEEIQIKKSYIRYRKEHHKMLLRKIVKDS